MSKELEEAINYLNNKDRVMEDDDYLGYDDSMKIVTSGVKQLIARVKRYEEALRFYADKEGRGYEDSKYHFGQVLMDVGNRARQALEEDTGE